MTSEEMLPSSEAAEEMRTGSFFDAEVDGLMSWVGEGARFKDADWIVEARVMAGLAAIVMEV
jgi:hypothetical protein